jgi:CBS domain-containing protein
MSVKAILKEKGNRVVTVRSDATAKHVIDTLAREGIGAVVVSDDDLEIVGIVSERDVIRALARHGAAAFELSATDVMTHAVTSARIDMHILHVLELMTAGRFRHMPVVDNGCLAGLVSIGDAVKARLDTLEQETHELKEYIGGR